jgi:MFS family permease
MSESESSGKSAAPAGTEASQTRVPVFETLRIRSFRFLLADSAFNMMGFQARMMAQAWLVLSMTDSDLWVGVVNGLPAIPVVFLTLFGGVMADRLDRRVMLVWSRVAMASLGLMTALLITADVVELWHLMVIAFFVAVTQALGVIASQTMIIDIVGRERIFNANALFGSAFNFSMFAGPAVGGVLIARVGIDAAFYSIAGMLVLAVYAAWNVRVKQPARVGPQTSIMRDLQDGLRYILGTPVFKWLLVLSFSLVFAGLWMPLLPRYARDVLDTGADGYGIILAAQGVGGIVGVITLIAAGSVRALGKILVVSTLTFTLLMVVFIFSTSITLSASIAAGFGFIIVWWANSLRVAFQISARDEMRGRVMSIFAIISQIFSVSWLLGGALSELIGPQATMMSGMVVCAAFYVAAYVRSPEIRTLGS